MRPFNSQTVSSCLLAAVVGAAVVPAARGSDNPVITEFMAVNDSTLADADLDYPDWIEVSNPTGAAIDLGGYYLTDDPDDLNKWAFPAETVLVPGGYIVVFASGKDRTVSGEELHTSFQLAGDGGYLALVAPDGTTVLSDYAPFYPPQFPDQAYGFGIAGSVTTTDLTPSTWVADTNYSNVSLGGADSDAGNGLDNGSGAPNTQRYMWLNFAGELGELPAGQRVLSAVLSWGGDAQLSIGPPTVPADVGVFPVPPADAGKGKPALEAIGSGQDLIDYYAANPPVASGATTPGETASFEFDVADLVDAWSDGSARNGEMMLLNSARPFFFRYNQVNGTSSPALSLRVQTTDATSDDPVRAYLDSPTPGDPNSGGEEPGPVFLEFTEHPPQPVAGPLTITANVVPIDRPVASVTMFYVHMFGTEISVEMVDDGTGGDAAAGDGIFTAVIPGSAVVAGEMVRWRFVATDDAGISTKEPPFREPRDSHEYYGTVGHDPDLEASTELPVLHWFAQNPRRAETSSGGFGAYYYLGEFYDNVYANLHGQSTSGGDFPKKSFNIDFNKTQRFRWDPEGEAPRLKDINLLTNWADKSRVRHVLAYEVMRNAGVAAHFAFTVRVQQNGEFFSVADFVEDGDDRYLERAGLDKDGALYKVYNHTLSERVSLSPSILQKKNRDHEDGSDLQEFVNGLRQNGAALRSFIYDNVDVPACINMLAANSVIRNIDMHRKNWYIYRDSDGTGEWTILPWDLDLSFGRRWNSAYTYFDNALYVDSYVQTGTTLRLVSAMFADPSIRPMIYRRIRSLSDEFLNAPGTPVAERYFERRLDEQLALVDPPELVPSDAERDFEAWGSWYHTGRPGGYRRVPFDFDTDPWVEQVETMEEAIGRWKTEYLPGRRDYIFNRQTVGNGGQIPANAQSSSPSPALVISNIEFSPPSGNQDEEYVEIGNPTGDAVDVSGWSLAGAVEFTFPGGTVIPAGSEVFVTPDKVAFRARATSPKGGEAHLLVGPYSGHLSSLGETLRLLDAGGTEVASASYTGDPSDVQLFLRVSEIMYHPATDPGSEFIELVNTSDSVTLDLTGVEIVAGVAFSFTGSAVTSLAPGARVLIVRSRAAFESVYGTAYSSRIAGEFADDTKLSNGGEEIDIEDATGSTVAKFSYGDGASWPQGADGGGFSLVLADPASSDPDLPESWAASEIAGGSPGHAGGGIEFPGDDPDADTDGDGLTDLVEWVLSGTLTDALLPEVEVERLEVGGVEDDYLVFLVRRLVAAAGVVVEPETAATLDDWGSGAVFVDETPLGDGTSVVRYRSAQPVSAATARFMRWKVTYLAAP